MPARPDTDRITATDEVQVARQSRAAGRNRGPSQRQLRAGELIRHALSEVFSREELHDDDLAGASITVSEVRMSPDLRQATCFVMPLAGRHADTVLAALKRRSAWLAGQVARRLELKFAPRLQFAIDHSFDEAAHIDALLRRVDTANTPPGDGDGS